MTIDKLKVSAANGVLENELSFEDWVETGYVDEPVKYSRFNRQLFRSDSKSNEIIDEVNDLRTTVGDSADDIEALQELTEKHTSVLDYTINKIDDDLLKSGFFSYETGMMPYNDLLYGGSVGSSNNVDQVITMIGDTRVLIVINVTRIAVYNLDTYEWMYDKTFSSIGLPSNTIAVSACSDGVNLYFVAYTNLTTIYKAYAIDMSTWQPASGWSPSGTTLGTYAKSFENRFCRARMASVGKIVISQPWVEVSDGNSPGLIVLSTTDGSVLGSGTGDCGTLTDGQVLGCTSNGTNVFFGVCDLSDEVKICSMSLSTYNTGCGWPAQPESSVSFSANFGDILCSGSRVIATFNDQTTLFSIFDEQKGESLRCTVGDAEECNALYNLTTDGYNFWAIGNVKYTDTGTYYSPKLFKLNVLGGRRSATVSTVETTTNSHTTSCKLYNGVDLTAETNFVNMTIKTDGNSIYASTPQVAGILRLRRANQR